MSEITGTGPLDPVRLKAARARTVQEWMELYLEVIEMNLKRVEIERPDLHDRGMANYQQSGRPHLRSIAAEFQSAGLDLVEEIQVEGPEIGPFGPKGEMALIWPSQTHKVTYFWPDGSKLQFQGERADHSIGFFMFWQSQQKPIRQDLTGFDQGMGRIVSGAERENYFASKKADQQRGVEPDDV